MENRNAMLDASSIRVEIVGSKVILHGTVRTLELLNGDPISYSTALLPDEIHHHY